MPKIEFWIKVAHGLAWLARKLHLDFLLRSTRNAATNSLVTILHEDIIHRIRWLECVLKKRAESPDAASSGDPSHQRSGDIAKDICTSCSRVMETMLGIPLKTLHCSIKLIDRSDPNQPLVRTFARSEPFDIRSEDVGRHTTRPLTSHSAWAALTGRDDGNRNWRTPHCCFICNDLRKQGRFVCPRENWSELYRAMLVLPLRRAIDTSNRDFEHAGFLTFDTFRENAFFAAPCVFDEENAGELRSKMVRLAYFHIAAMIGDMLASMLSGIAEQDATS